MELTAKQKRAAEEFAADERYRAALKSISEFAELCGRQQATITAGLERLEQALEQKSEVGQKT
jgi:DNA-binding MurR/RpiR family transcriptional regulator